MPACAATSIRESVSMLNRKTERTGGEVQNKGEDRCSCGTFQKYSRSCIRFCRTSKPLSLQCLACFFKSKRRRKKQRSASRRHVRRQNPSVSKLRHMYDTPDFPKFVVAQTRISRTDLDILSSNRALPSLMPLALLDHVSAWFGESRLFPGALHAMLYIRRLNAEL